MEVIIVYYDKSKNEVYKDLGITLDPPNEATYGARKFLGWGWTNPENIHWSDCAPDGLQYATVTYTIFWLIPNGTKQITRPCQ